MSPGPGLDELWGLGCGSPSVSHNLPPLKTLLCQCVDAQTHCI